MTSAPIPSTVASYNGWTSVGCKVDAVSVRTLPHTVSTAGGGAALTVELCLDACHTAGYEYAGEHLFSPCKLALNLYRIGV